jgi:hypothetical protein
MKHLPLTKDLGEKLLNEGYSHFVISRRKEKDEFRNPDAMLTLEATTDLTESQTLPIKQMIDLPEDKLQAIYVICDG